MRRHPPRGFRGLCFTKPKLVSTRLNSSLVALCSHESNPEAQENFKKNPNELSSGQLRTTERIVKNVLDLRQYSSMLHVFALEGYLNEGKSVHGNLIKIGLDPDAHLWNSLADFYAKCGSHKCARRVLDQMPERDVVSWTALISGLIADGYERDGFCLFCDMTRDGVRPNGYTLATALKGCSMCLDVGFGEQLHAEVIKIGFFSNIFVGSSLVDLYAKCGELKLADRVLFCMPEWNAASCSALLNGYNRMGEGEEVLKLFSRITEFETKFSCFTLSAVLKGCANSGKLREAQSVHCAAIKVGCELGEYVSSVLLNVYSNFELLDDAHKVFRRIKNPNIVAWSEMINCLNKQDQSQEAAELLCQMRHKGIRPNQFTLTSLVSAASNLGDWSYGESIHACICKYGFESYNFITNALVVMYMKMGFVQKGWLLFDTIIDRDLVSWNALLSGVDGGDDETYDQGPGIFKQILVEGFKPDMYTFTSILRDFSCLLNVKFGKQMHAHIVKNGLNGNSYVGTALINLYAHNGCLEDANVIFNRLHKKDLLTWTVIIAGYAQNDKGDKAIDCFRQMQQEGIRPNEFTLSSCLSGCSNIATSETGRQLHSLALKVALSRVTYVASSLVDMYVKCRSIEDAEAVFKDMVERNIASWNTIICGYSQHGKGMKALEAFQLMLDEGFVPDEVTLFGILAACSHMGLVEEGKKLFNSLSKVGITPTIKHHTCMVNILCRAGKFQEVENFIVEMKLAENTWTWETVIWASKMHGNVEFGQKAAEKLFELEPEMDYNYIMLSDIFATKERWDDVANVRELMASRGIKKEPGCSWVKIDDQAHMFFAQDNSDPNIKEICLQLGDLTR